MVHVEESSCNFDNSDQNIQGMQAMNANLQPAKVKAKIAKQLVPLASDSEQQIRADHEIDLAEHEDNEEISRKQSEVEQSRPQQRQEASAIVDTIVSSNHKIDESILSCNFEVNSQQAPLNTVNATNTMRELKRQPGQVAKDVPDQEDGSISLSVAVDDEEPIDINPVRNVAITR